jgi:hypothetical protein
MKTTLILLSVAGYLVSCGTGYRVMWTGSPEQVRTMRDCMKDRSSHEVCDAYLAMRKR